MKLPFSLFTLFCAGCVITTELQHEQDDIAFRLPEAVALAIAKDPAAQGLFTELSAELHNIAKRKNEIDGVFFAEALLSQFHDDAHPETNAALGLWENFFTLAYARHGTKSADTFRLVEQIANAIDEGRHGPGKSHQPTHL